MNTQTVIDESAWVADTATVKGYVTIAGNCGIWFGAVVRAEAGTVMIGRNSNVQDNSVVHTDPGHNVVIGDGVTIGHNATIHGCEIGDNTLIGMGAIVLNGAKIGRSCLIGAGSLVTEHTVIPDGSLAFGSPAKVQRPLTEEEIRSLTANAMHYVDIAGKYKAGLFG